MGEQSLGLSVVCCLFFLFLISNSRGFSQSLTAHAEPLSLPLGTNTPRDSTPHLIQDYLCCTAPRVALGFNAEGRRLDRLLSAESETFYAGGVPCSCSRVYITPK